MTYKPNKAQRNWASGGKDGWSYGSTKLPTDIDLNTMTWSPEAAARHRAIGNLTVGLNFSHNTIRATHIC